MIIRLVLRLYILLFILLNLSACVTPVKKSNPLLNAIDQTMGSYTRFQNDKLILLTMENASHQQLSQGQLINSSDNLPAPYQVFIDNLSDKYNLQRVADWPLDSLGIRCFVFEPDTVLAQSRLDEIALEEHVESVQALQIYNTLASGYNDPLVELQEGFSTMGIEQTHSYATGKGVKIAVIDTGIDVQHTELKKRIPFKKNFVDKSQSNFEDDIHGTAIAGVIGSNAGNAEGMVGVAPDAELYALKSCWQESKNYQDAYCNTFTLAKAINVAILKQVDIINLSLGGPEDPLLARLVNKAIEKNIVVVGAVHPRLNPSFPTAIPGVIAVWEKPLRNAADPDRKVFAQGNKVISTTPDNKYDFYSGSSISTAHVTGIIALIRQREPHLPYAEIHQLLIDHQSESNPVNACEIFASLIGTNNCI